jgi:hypothetical protein
MAEVGAVNDAMRDILLRGYQPWAEQNNETPSIASTIRYLVEVKRGMQAAPLPGRQQSLVMEAVDNLITEQRNHILIAILEEMGDIVEDLPRG